MVQRLGNSTSPAVPGGELFGLAGPLGDQTGGTVGVVSTGTPAGMFPAGDAIGMVRTGSPVLGGGGIALSGGSPGGLTSDGSLTPAG